MSLSSVKIERWMGFTGAVTGGCIIILGSTKCMILAMPKFCPIRLATDRLLPFEPSPLRHVWRGVQSVVPVKEPEGREQNLRFVRFCAFVSKTLSCQQPSSTFVDTWSTWPFHQASMWRCPWECSTHTQISTGEGPCQLHAKSLCTREDELWPGREEGALVALHETSFRCALFDVSTFNDLSISWRVLYIFHVDLLTLTRENMASQPHSFGRGLL